MVGKDRYVFEYLAGLARQEGSQLAGCKASATDTSGSSFLVQNYQIWTSSLTNRNNYYINCEHFATVRGVIYGNGCQGASENFGNHSTIEC